MNKNLIIIHGGGPTAVINASLYGAIREAQESPEVERIYCAIGGTGGLLNDKLRDVTNLTDDVLRGLLSSPASAIGSSRDALEAPEYEAMVGKLKKYGIRYVLMNGGNGTMDTCGKLQRHCEGTDIRVVGIPTRPWIMISRSQTMRPGLQALPAIWQVPLRNSAAMWTGCRSMWSCVKH